MSLIEAFFFLIIPRPPISTLFPYTTLFRSHVVVVRRATQRIGQQVFGEGLHEQVRPRHQVIADRKSTRLNSSHMSISYAVFCLKKKKSSSVKSKTAEA